ncbi:hypothetical protein A2W14_04945 [Candidatus Gottesmanbacteria bacterium RBG_16_37_8]|uniref:phosphoserine phosphatase n=1 Tax=Candidatus Gottesmanbacteria bacterium RBG_16_37_8 TaxID=1798371 RepID=A0A1F5YUH0_9BACT|nr:MAG: hypothetical protein A2W14_04945 [Candidatus Gottesmanbacteria bacterium RBG_16_37_8]
MNEVLPVTPQQIKENGFFLYKERLEKAKELALKGAGTLLGDGESTFWKGEAFVIWGIERGAGDTLKAMTEYAQTEDDFGKSLKLRLPIAAPTDSMIQQVDKKFSNSITPGVITIRELLEDLKVRVEIVSGGWIQTMDGVSKKLRRIPISANRLVKGPNGRYIFYEDQRLLAQKNSKKGHVESVINDYKPPIFVMGDGKPDMQIVPADLKILFTQHCGPRPIEIEEMADVVIDNISLVLPLILGEERWDTARYNRDPNVRKLFTEGALSILAGQGVKFKNKEYGCEIINRLSRYMDLSIDFDTAPIQARPNLIYSYS